MASTPRSSHFLQAGDQFHQGCEESVFIVCRSDYTHRMNLLDPLFRSSAVDNLFTDRAALQGMLDFELARAKARISVIPGAAAAAIAKKCRAELFDTAALAQAAAHAGNVAIPLVKQLAALVAKKDKQAAHFVHWGNDPGRDRLLPHTPVAPGIGPSQGRIPAGEG